MYVSLQLLGNQRIIFKIPTAYGKSFTLERISELFSIPTTCILPSELQTQLAKEFNSKWTDNMADFNKDGKSFHCPFSKVKLLKDAPIHLLIDEIDMFFTYHLTSHRDTETN